MGMGRNSSRIATRRLATSTKESGAYRDDIDEGKTDTFYPYSNRSAFNFVPYYEYLNHVNI